MTTGTKRAKAFKKRMLKKKLAGIEKRYQKKIERLEKELKNIRLLPVHNKDNKMNNISLYKAFSDEKISIYYYMSPKQFEEENDPIELASHEIEKYIREIIFQYISKKNKNQIETSLECRFLRYIQYEEYEHGEHRLVFHWDTILTCEAIYRIALDNI